MQCLNAYNDFDIIECDWIKSLCLHVCKRLTGGAAFRSGPSSSDSNLSYGMRQTVWLYKYKYIIEGVYFFVISFVWRWPRVPQVCRALLSCCWAQVPMWAPRHPQPQPQPLVRHCCLHQLLFVNYRLLHSLSLSFAMSSHVDSADLLPWVFLVLLLFISLSKDYLKLFRSLAPLWPLPSSLDPRLSFSLSLTSGFV